MIDSVIFNYRIEDILEEVTKRTSYLGKMRNTEAQPFLVDRLSLTRGEGFMFSEFLEDAVSETYDWLKAFGRCIPMYDKIVIKYEDIKITAAQDEDNSGNEFPDAEFPEVEATSTEQADFGETNPDANVPTPDPPEIDFPTNDNQPVTINKGTYVEYHHNPINPDDYEVYQVNSTCTTENWKDFACKLAIDPRGCIVFIFERTCHMDFNLISSIDRNIKEALVNYIIYKWFEYTNVDEADKFFYKFEDYAHKAQLGMNSETKILQRKYNINM